MNKYLTKYRIRWWVTALFQILCAATFLLPTVKVVGTDSLLGVSDTVIESVPWWIGNSLSEMGIPNIYSAVFWLFFLLCVPLIICSFTKKLYRWPIVLSLVVLLIFTLFNAFWTVIFFLAISSVSGIFSVTFTAWGWAFIVITLAQIINLILFIPALKKA